MKMVKRYTLLLLATCAPVLLAVFLPASAFGFAAEAPQWTVTAYSLPTNLSSQAGSTGYYKVQVQNTGGAPSDGSTVTVTDILPPGLKATAAASGVDWVTGTAMSCAGETCTYAGVVGIDDFLELKIPVEVSAGAKQTETNTVTVAGGGALEASRETPTTIGAEPAKFGIAPGSTATALSTDQAGAHPDLTSTIAYDTVGQELLAGDPKESGLVLPPGFVGDLADTPRCPVAEFSEIKQGLGGPQHCALSTIVGTVTVTLTGAEYIHAHITVPLYNLSTNPGEIAKLGFHAILIGIQATVLLTPGDYGVDTTFQKIPDNGYQLQGISITVWGVPADPRHDLMRGLVCSSSGHGSVVSECGYENATEEVNAPNGQAVTGAPIPYLTSPTDCTGAALYGTFSASSWRNRSVKSACRRRSARSRVAACSNSRPRSRPRRTLRVRTRRRASRSACGWARKGWSTSL